MKLKVFFLLEQIELFLYSILQNKWLACKSISFFLNHQGSLKYRANLLSLWSLDNQKCELNAAISMRVSDSEHKILLVTRLKPFKF